jgi:hypothetical protein
MTILIILKLLHQREKTEMGQAVKLLATAKLKTTILLPGPRKGPGNLQAEKITLRPSRVKS